jgi:hypothetical protein
MDPDPQGTEPMQYLQLSLSASFSATHSMAKTNIFNECLRKYEKRNTPKLILVHHTVFVILSENDYRCFKHCDVANLPTPKG